jgi:pyruvate-formate lyase-activating enzyme
LILKNLKTLSQRNNAEVIVRVPIIPGRNDTEDNIRSTAKFVAALNDNIKTVEILPYHKFGEKSIPRPSRAWEYQATRTCRTLKGLWKVMG